MSADVKPFSADDYAWFKAVLPLSNVNVVPGIVLRLIATAEADVGLLRRVLSEYVAGNRIVDGYWYSPDENGAPHYRNGPAALDEVALIESLHDEDRQ